MVAIMVLLTILTFLTIDWALERRAANRSTAPATVVGAQAPRVAPRPAEPGRLETVPAGLFVGPGHVWLGLEPQGTVRLGADRLAGTLLGGLDSLQVLPRGWRVRRGDPVVVMRRNGREIRLRAPVEGVVEEVNPRVQSDPTQVVDAPYEDGWLYRLRPMGLSGALSRMHVAEEAKGWMSREIGKLRDFLTGLHGEPALAPATLADGGLPVAGLAAALDEAQWSDLSSRMFDVPQPDGVRMVDPFAVR